MTLDLETCQRAPKVLLHDHLDGGLRPETVVELAAETGYAELPTDDPVELRPVVPGVGRLGVAGALPGDVRPHRRGDADRRRAAPGRARVRRGPRRRRRRLRRGALRPGAAHRGRADPRGGHRGRARRLRRGRAGHGRGGPPDRHADACSPPCGPRRAARRSPSAWSPTATPAWSASTSPAPRRATRPPGTWTPSSTCAGRTPTSPSTPVRRSACPASGRRSSGAGRSASAMACTSWTTSPASPTARSTSVGWRPTSATGASRWRCARAPTCRPARPAPSRSTRSACCAPWASG